MIGNLAGIFIFSALAAIRARQALDGSWLDAALTLQAALAVIAYFRRGAPKRSAAQSAQALAWASALLPLLFSPQQAQASWLALLPLPGLALALWAMFSLGDSFSIAPADRGLVRRGPYRLLRHPMYAGELLSLAGVLAAALTLRNVSLFAVFAASVLWRVRMEEALIDGYAGYRAKTKWRLLWRVW